MRKSNFLVRIPDNVIVMSTSRFLRDLEQHKLISSASEILSRAVAVRAKAVLKEPVRATGDAAGLVESWPARRRP